MSHGELDDASAAREIEQAVIAYLNNHPQAADTLDGIVAWWLPRQRYETARERIASVVDGLVDAGVLRCKALPDGGGLYAIKQQGLADHRGERREEPRRA
jgi:hypothetical protein